MYLGMAVMAEELALCNLQKDGFALSIGKCTSVKLELFAV
jgi:hypothetical protein